MSALNKLNSAAGMEKAKDVVGGGSYLWDSAVYKTVVDMAYVDVGDSGALNVHMSLKDAEGKELKSVQCIQSGDAKGNNPFYERDGKQYPLPGHNIVSAILAITINSDLDNVKTEEKQVKVYDFSQGAEVIKKVDVLVDLLGQRIDLGVIHQITDKNVKNAAGKWVPSGETREENEIAAVFRASDGLSKNEIEEKATSPDFQTAWAEKWTGVVRNKAKGAKKDTGVSAGAPTTAPGTASLFA